MWKYSFWCLLFFVVGAFLTLFQIGVLKVNLQSSHTLQDSSFDLRSLERRSVAEGDGGQNAHSPFPATVVDGTTNDDDRFEREYKYNIAEDENGDNDDSITVVDDSSSADGGSTNETDGEKNVEDADAETNDKGRIKGSKATGSKKDNKKNVLSEDELLNYHSKAVSKIWAPNIERNLV